MTFEEIENLIIQEFGAKVISNTEANIPQPCLTIQTEKVAEVCLFLRDNQQTFFDYLSCLTALDNGLKENTLEVIYHLNSIPFEHTLVLKIMIERNSQNEALPKVPSVAEIWGSANWHEREAYDLVGIEFENHSDLRRILLPADWKGHPLRKDYGTDKNYHGIEIDY